MPQNLHLESSVNPYHYLQDLQMPNILKFHYTLSVMYQKQGWRVRKHFTEILKQLDETSRKAIRSNSITQTAKCAWSQSAMGRTFWRKCLQLSGSVIEIQRSNHKSSNVLDILYKGSLAASQPFPFYWAHLPQSLWVRTSSKQHRSSYWYRFFENL